MVWLTQAARAELVVKNRLSNWRRIIVGLICNRAAVFTQISFDALNLGTGGGNVGHNCGRGIRNTEGRLLLQEDGEALTVRSQALLLLLVFIHRQPPLRSIPL